MFILLILSFIMDGKYIDSVVAKRNTRLGPSAVFNEATRETGPYSHANPPAIKAEKSMNILKVRSFFIPVFILEKVRTASCMVFLLNSIVKVENWPSLSQKNAFQ